MDTLSRQHIIKNLFDEHITGKDVTFIAGKFNIVKSTVYRYLSMEEKDVSTYSKIVYDDVVECALNILKHRSIELSSLLEKL